MNLETKITIYKFTPQVFTLTPLSDNLGDIPFQIIHSYNRSLITQK